VLAHIYSLTIYFLHVSDDLKKIDKLKRFDADYDDYFLSPTFFL
jgi:hypothetical protein